MSGSDIQYLSHIGWKCRANRTADPPQDCDWPSCGCDPYADRVIGAIQESGFVAKLEADNARLRESVLHLAQSNHGYSPDACSACGTARKLAEPPETQGKETI